jgi:hypothetical protein
VSIMIRTTSKRYQGSSNTNTDGAMFISNTNTDPRLASWEEGTRTAIPRNLFPRGRYTK